MGEAASYGEDGPVVVDLRGFLDDGARPGAMAVLGRLRGALDALATTFRRADDTSAAALADRYAAEFDRRAADGRPDLAYLVGTVFLAKVAAGWRPVAVRLVMHPLHDGREVAAALHGAFAAAAPEDADDEERDAGPVWRC